MVLRKHILIAVLALLSAREGFSQGEGRSRLDRLRSGDPKLVEQALVELRKNGNPSNEESSLLAYLALRNNSTAIETLRILGPQTAIGKIVSTLEQGKPQDRVSAARVLGRLGRHAKDALPGLLKVLSDTEGSVRYEAAIALGDIGEHAKDAVPALVKALSDKSLDVRMGAERALIRLGQHARDAVPALIKVLSDANVESSVRIYAASALGSIGAQAKEVVPALIRAMSDNDYGVRLLAASALGNMGEHAKDAVPALITALSDKEKYVRDSAQKAIDLIAPEDELTAPKQFPKNSGFEICKTLSALAKNAIWDNLEGYTSEFRFPQDGWDVAMSSLQALYLSKAGPVSKNSEATCSSNDEMGQLTGFAQSLINLLERSERQDDSLWSSADIYAKIYRLQLLRGKNSLEAARIRTSLIENLKELKEQGIGGSAFNTYAWGAAVVALAPEIPAEILTKLEEWVKKQPHPMMLPYAPHQTFKPSRRASAARNVPVHLALFLGKKGKVERSRLVEAIEVWKKYSGDLAGEVSRDGTHEGRDALAPYYFYSSLPYVTSAIKILEQEGALEPDELARLRVVKKELRSGLPKLMNSDGTLGLLPGGPNYKETMYTSSPAYTYPLYGLALIPLLEPGDSCMKESLASDLGIVNLK